MKTLKRRRKEHKTDYKKRLKLLKSKSPRVVFRKSNRYVSAQYVISNEARDKIIIGVSSKHLIKYGWPKEISGSLKSIPASYLTGYLFGRLIIKKKLEIPIVDFGMVRNLHKTKSYAFLRGLRDSGLKINCKEETFPEEERIEGKKMKKDFSKEFKEIKLKIDKS